MRSGEHTRWSPARRLLLLACLLSVLAGGVAGFTWSAKPAARDSTRVLLVANHVERLVTDLDRGQLGYVATGDTGALTPWHAARAAFPGQAALLQRLATENSPEQGRRAREIVRSVTSYLHEHAEPLVRTARRDREGARSVLLRAEGKRRIEAIRRQLDQFAAVQHGLAVAHERDALPAARRLMATAAGTSGSFLLIFLGVGYVMRVRHREPVAHDPAVHMGLETSSAERAAGESLRHLATRIAEGASPAEVCSMAAAAMGRALDAGYTLICRYEDDGTVTTAGHWSAAGASAPMPPLGGRWPVEDETVTDLVYRTGRPAHLRADLPAVGRIGAWIRANGIRRLTACPVTAADRLWGMAAVLSREHGPWPAGTTRTVEEFAGLLGTAVANARHRAELAASRVRLVEAADATRRRAERELHETTQQRLVTVGLELRATELAVPPELDGLRERISRAAHDVAEIIDGLQDVSRRLHPAFLVKRGLESSLRALARRAPLPVELEIQGEHMPPPVAAVTVHHVVAEALANAARHARASGVRIRLVLAADGTRLRVDDDGTGGARAYPGSSLGELRDRTEALGGSFEIVSPPGGGTALRVALPTGPASARH